MKTASILVPVCVALLAFPQIASAAPSRAYQVAERGSGFKIMQSVRAETNAAGQVSSATNRITILANGMHRKDASGNWVESVPVIQSYPAAIVCTGAAYRVILNRNLNRSGRWTMNPATDSGLSLIRWR